MGGCPTVDADVDADASVVVAVVWERGGISQVDVRTHPAVLARTVTPVPGAGNDAA